MSGDVYSLTASVNSLLHARREQIDDRLGSAELTDGQRSSVNKESGDSSFVVVFWR